MTAGSRPEDARSRASRVTEQLNRLPKAAVFLGALALALIAFFTPGVAGAVVVGLLAVVVAAHLALTWRRQPPPQRIAQALALGVLILIALTKLA